MCAGNAFPTPWLPADYESAAQIVAALFGQVKPLEDVVLQPVILEFAALIQRDPVVRMLMTSMVEQIPARYQDHHPKTVEELLRQLNAVLTLAPAYVPPTGPQQSVALVGCPFSAILIWTMGTPAGFAAYRDPRINGMFKQLLGVWSRYLDSEASTSVLNASPTGWQCAAARAQLDMADYQHEPRAPHWGFPSWNAFFTRPLKPGARPIQGPEDSSAIVAPCDSTVFRIARGLTRQAPFWIKAQPYSLEDMLDHQQVEAFLCGDLLQAYLSPFNYHRWHSPVAGTVRQAFVKEGLYFGQAPAEGEDWTDQNHSQAFITHVQTRAIIFIEADNPAIGLLCVLPVGMVEISSCILNDRIVPGARVEKGQELGYFQFGGSTHCVLFRQGVVSEFTRQPNQPLRMGEIIAFAHRGGGVDT